MGRLDKLYKTDVPHRAKLVYIYLHDRMDKERKAVKDLEKAGLIRKEPHCRENGSATSNRYYLL